MNTPTTTPKQPQGNKYQTEQDTKKSLQTHGEAPAHARMQQMELLARFCMAEARKSTIEERVLAYMACFSVHGEYFTGKGRRKELCERLGISESSYKRAVDTLVKAGVLKRLRSAKIGSQFISYRLPGIIFNARESNDNYTFTVEVKR